MGLTTGSFPPVDPATFMETPYRDRIKTLSRHWAEYGFGAPKITAVIYVVKLLCFYIVGGALVATLTSGLDPLHPAAWWDNPIVYQKAVLWTILLEGLGVAGSWGPLAGHFKPMTGGFRYYGRVRTIRQPPWPGKVPLTGGDDRTAADVALYVALVASFVVALVLPGVDATAAAPSGLVSPAAVVPSIVLLIVAGLRDKTIFIAARGEQYLPALVFFAFFPFVDMIVAAKLLIVIVWMGAAFSKFGRHFANVIPPRVPDFDEAGGAAATRLDRERGRRPAADQGPGRPRTVPAHRRRRRHRLVRGRPAARL